MQGAIAEDQQAPTQKARVRQVLLILTVGGLGHMLVVWVALQLDFFRGSSALFGDLFTLFWTGHVGLMLFTLLGLNRRLKNPDMIVPMMVWTTFALVLSAYYVDQVRLCVMIMFFAILQVGVFRVRFAGFAVLSGLAVAGYGLIVWLVARWHPEAVDFTAEIIQWAAFTLMTTAFVVLAAEISSIRVQLTDRNGQLGEIVEKIQEMAIKDELTGLYNRRHAMERMRKLREMANRGAFEFVVAFVDLDCFKQVNDNYGHQVGDDVLRVFANTARKQVSGRDFCARFGGEEFVLVLVKTSLEQGEQVAESLRAAMEVADIASAPGLHVTTSVGLARFEPGETVEGVLTRADNALYEAKESGRNRIVRAEDTA